MIIENVASSFPVRKVCNDEVVDLVRFHSKNFNGDLQKLLRVVKTLLDRSGLVNRNWRGDADLPIDHIAQAVFSALGGTAFQPKDIDLFIYVGIGGGFREPGNSYMIAKSLGFKNAQCFDVIDACMSWTRAVSLVDSLFKTGKFRNAMIVNGEFNVFDESIGFPAYYAVGSFEELNYLLPSYTIGEAATATLLLPQDSENFTIAFHSKPDLADLCMIPLSGSRGYYKDCAAVAKLGENRFNARGAELHEHLLEELPVLIEQSRITPAAADIVFTHTSSTPAWNKVGDRYGFSEKIFHIYPETGNVVSASVPAAMAKAKDEGKLTKGKQVAFLMGSAGMSFAISEFVF